MANKIVLKNQSNKIVKIISKNIILTNQYYTAQQVQVEGSPNTKIMYKLLSSANPFMSLYQLYTLYALSSPVKVTRQFIKYVIKCWKIYQPFTKKQNFIHIFFGRSYVQKMQVCENDDAFLAVQNVTCLSQQKLNSKEYLDQFQSSEQLLRLTIQSNLVNLAKESKQYEQLSFKLRLLPKMAKESANNLENIIIHQQQRIKILEKVCVKLPKQWQVQLLFDQNNQTAYILTKYMLKQQQQAIPFQDYLHPFYQKQSDLKQFQVEKLAFEIISKLQNYNKKCPFQITMNPENFIVILKKQENRYILSQAKCQINYMGAIMEHFGLNRLTATAENKLIFESRYQPLHKKMDFRKQLQKFISPDKIYDANNAIKWMIYFDYIFCKLFGKGKTSILESCPSSNQRWEEYVLDKIADHQYVQNETYLFHSWTICVLDSLLNDFAPLKSNGMSDKKEQILSIISLKNLKYIFFQQQKRIVEQKYSENQDHVQLIVKILQFQSNLYFSQDGIRSFFLHNKNLSQLTSQKRYLCLYFLAKLVQLNILLILNLFRIKQQQDKRKIKQSYDKFNKIIQKLSQKVIQSRSKENDKKTEQQRYLYSCLQKITIQQQTHSKEQEQQIYLQSLIRNIRIQLNNIMSKPTSLIVDKFQYLNQRNDNKKINKNSLVTSKTCFLYVSIFSQLNIKNFVDYMFIQKQLREIKNKQKLLTSDEIYNQIKKIQGKLLTDKQEQKQ